MENLLNHMGTYWIIGISIIGFITRSIIKLVQDMMLERHKISLQRTHMERQIKFSKLYNDQGEVLRSIYTKLSKLERSLTDLAGYSSKEFADISMHNIIDLKRFFEDNKIIINEKLANQVEIFITILHNAYFEISWNHEYQIHEITVDSIKEETLKKRESGFKTIKETLPKLKKELEIEFRTILGVNQ